MNLKEVKLMARSLGIVPRNMKKAELIQEIQKTESNQPCFGTAGDSCDQSECLWRKDCLK